MAGCNLCGATEWVILEQSGTVQVVKCRCNLIFVTPQPSIRQLEQAYQESYYRPWEDQGCLRKGIWRRRMEMVEGYGTAPGRLLDVGCGMGEFLTLARDHGWDVMGTELSQYACEVGGASGVKMCQGEIWDAGLPSNSFDMVTSWHSLEHVRDPLRVVGEMYRVLKPGGRLFVATPNVKDFIFQWAYLITHGRRPPLYEPDEREVHLFHFCSESLERLLTECRFRVLEIGFDREGVAVWSKRLISECAFLWFKVTGLHWGPALQAIAEKPLQDRKARETREHQAQHAEGRTLASTQTG